jgi:hypothetical protein
MHADDGDSTGRRRRLNRETTATQQGDGGDKMLVVTGISST